MYNPAQGYPDTPYFNIDNLIFEDPMVNTHTNAMTKGGGMSGGSGQSMSRRSKITYRYPYRFPGSGMYLQVQSPSGCQAPFGLSAYSDEGIKNLGNAQNGDIDENASYSIQFTVDPMNGGEEHIRFYDMLCAIDERIIQVATENSKKWFGRQLGEETIREKYYSFIKPPKEGTAFPPTIRTKVYLKGGSPIAFFDGTCSPPKRITWQEFQKFSSNIYIAELTGLWFTAKSFGPSLNCKQVLTFGGGQEWNSLAITSPMMEEDTSKQQNTTTFGDYGDEGYMWSNPGVGGYGKTWMG